MLFIRVLMHFFLKFDAIRDFRLIHSFVSARSLSRSAIGAHGDAGDSAQTVPFDKCHLTY